MHANLKLGENSSGASQQTRSQIGGGGGRSNTWTMPLTYSPPNQKRRLYLMAAQLHPMQIFLRSGASLKRHFPQIINIQETWWSQLKLLGFEWYVGAQHELVTTDLLTGCLLKGLENELRLKEDRNLFRWQLWSHFLFLWLISHRAFNNIVLIKVWAEMWEHGNLATV